MYTPKKKTTIGLIFVINKETLNIYLTVTAHTCMYVRTIFSQYSHSAYLPIVIAFNNNPIITMQLIYIHVHTCT